MTPNIALAIAYLLSEAVNTGRKLSDILAKADATGALPPEEMAKIKASLKHDFAHARAYWD